MNIKNFIKKINKDRGSILIYEVVIIFIFSTILLAVLSNAAYQLKIIRSTVNREQALQIAEAGVNYYQWHLSHFPADYQDGTGAAGPYVHNYVDKDSNQLIGAYSLNITPPPIGSTVVTISSTGWTFDNPNQKRTITTRYGIPSLAKYAFLTNSDVWIGNNESVSGEMHANGGIRFDGTGNAPISSAKQTYTCQTYHGCSPAASHDGVWGAAPAATQSFWQFPVPTIDFTTITSNLATMRSDAQTNGIFLAPSNAQGYSLVFNAAGTLNIYRVNSRRSHATGWDVNGVAHNEDLDYNGRTLLFSNIAMPTNGLIYVEDTTWVEGTVNGRAMVVAARLPYNPATAPSIIIPNNITYATKNGTVNLGLLAQKDILISFFAPTVLNVDAAMIAQNGSAQRFFFSGNVKTSLTIYGSLMSFGVWTWSWVNGSGVVTSGYQNTVTTYDPNLLYSPPPSFPLSSTGYQQISWTSN